MAPLAALRRRAQALKADTLTLYCALRHPDTPRAARWLALAVVAYALSPIDLIPDFIPILGLMDDLILLPLGIAIVIKLLPPEVLAQCREAAKTLDKRGLGKRPWAAAVILCLWLGCGLWLWRLLRP